MTSQFERASTEAIRYQGTSDEGQEGVLNVLPPEQSAILDPASIKMLIEF